LTDQSRFGAAAAFAGDVNHDGVGDVIIGAPWTYVNDVPVGSAHVFSGADGSRIYDFVGHSEADGLVGQCAVTGCGDANGDSYPDLLVSLHPRVYERTSAWLYSGKTGALLYTFEGVQKNDSFGSTLACAGDVDGDGLADILIGAEGHSVAGEHGGRVYALAGNDLFLNGTPKYLAPGDLFVRSVREGVPQNPSIVALVAVQDIPLFLVPEGIGRFDAQGSRKIELVVPPGLAGLQLGFQAFTLDQQNLVVASARENVVFE
jgi:hypothetical protein